MHADLFIQAAKKTFFGCILLCLGANHTQGRRPRREGQGIARVGHFLDLKGHRAHLHPIALNKL